MFWNVKEESDRPKRILIVRLGAMGDVIQTLPAVSDLRRRFPEARIDWAIDTRWAELLRGNPDINESITLPSRPGRQAKLRLSAWRKAAAQVRHLQTAKYDLALDFQGLLKSAAVAKLSRAARIVGFDRRLLREPFAEVAYTLRLHASSGHVVDRYRELASFGDPRQPALPAVFPLPRGAPSRHLPASFVLASPQAGWGSKQWPGEYYSALATLLWDEHRLPLLVDCSPAQEEYAETILRHAAKDSVIVHISTIAQLIAATRQATAVVGVDSGPLHLAAALGKRGVAIFGPTDPARNGPCGTSFSVLRHEHAATSYKRSPTPSASMLACGPQLVFERLRPLLV